MDADPYGEMKSASRHGGERTRSARRGWTPTILCWGGIGDTLRNIALVPHGAIHRSTGLRCRVVHRHWRDAGCLAVAEPPEPAFFERLPKRVPSLEWRGESGEHRGLARVANRAVRGVAGLFNGGRPRYFPTEFRLTANEEGALAAFPDGRMLGVQTHLGGMQTKRWGLDRWRQFLERLAGRFPLLNVRLVDSSPQVEELRVNARVFTTHGLDLAQSLGLCRRFDLVVSVDSWIKYVAAWNRTPQIVIVPDQRPEYPALSAEKLAAVEFAGILGAAGNTVIGLEAADGLPRLTLPSLAQLTPESLFERVAARLVTLGF